jgi:hypothetical protein
MFRASGSIPSHDFYMSTQNELKLEFYCSRIFDSRLQKRDTAENSFSKQKPHKHVQPNQHLSCSQVGRSLALQAEGSKFDTRSGHVAVTGRKRTLFRLNENRVFRIES